MPALKTLYLTQDPALITEQLSGRRLTLAEAGPLRDDLSTDEITPLAIMGYYDHRLGDFAHTGLRCGEASPIGRGALRASGVEVLVAGNRYGKGSSREHSPTAERLAGVQLVFARSFERIYRQNADNIGLWTSTRFDLLVRIERGEVDSIKDLFPDLIAEREGLGASILAAGGLLRWGQTHLPAACGSLAPFDASLASGPQTLAEKILHRHLIRTAATPLSPAAGEGVFVRADWRFIHEYYTGMADTLLRGTLGDDYRIVAPESVVVFEDHTADVERSPAHQRDGMIRVVREMAQAQRDFARRHQLRFYRTLSDLEAAQEDGSNVAGISHAMMTEHHALPGQLVAGTDSHTPHSGALGCLAFGVGTTDMANAFVTGAVRVFVPEVFRIALDGAMPAGVTAKDLVLHLLALPEIRSGAAIGKVFEFIGPVIRALSIDERATITNMTAEMGGLTGIVEPDDRTVAFLRERRGIDFQIEPWMHSDPGASAAQELRIDCSCLTPMVARPGDPGQGLPLAALTERPRIDIAYGGSCTAGKREDFDLYHQVLAWARERGLRLPSGVCLYLQCGTTAVRDYCTERGYIETFRAVGAELLQPSCGACANCGPGSSERADQVTISAINRNFPGRSGPGRVWLASPPTVAASAIAGRIVSFEELKASLS